jgi:hypothetical protein
MRFSCQLLLGRFRREVGYSSVIHLALRDKLTDAHFPPDLLSQRIAA